MNLAAIQVDLAAVWLVDAGDHLDQGRFSGAIFSQQGMDLAWDDVKRDTMQHFDASEALGNVSQLKDFFAHRTAASSGSQIEKTIPAPFSFSIHAGASAESVISSEICSGRANGV